MRDLLGGKGANLAEMSQLGLPVPPGFTITTEVCTLLLRARPALSRRAEPSRSTPALRKVEETVGAGFGDAERPAARLGALRRAGLDAGHDGHGAESRPERRYRRGARAAGRATGASPTTATAASSRCTATSCSASTTTCSRTAGGEEARAAIAASTPSSRPRIWRGSSTATKASSPSAPARRSRRIRRGAALGRDRRRVRLAG